MKHKSLKLTPHFWDCECDRNYIHHRSIPACARCDARREDQPDSFRAEVAAHLQGVFAEVLQRFVLAVGDILEVERQMADASKAEPAGAPPTWVGAAITQKLAEMRLSGDVTPEPDEDSWLEAAYEDRFWSPDSGEW